MENTKYHSVGTIPTSKSVEYTVERDTIDNPNAYINDRSISRLGTGTSIESSGFKLVLWVYSNVQCILFLYKAS